MFSPHSPAKARDRANEFLKELYINEDAEEALSMTNDEFLKTYDKTYLIKLADKMRSKFGPAEGFKADFYVLDPRDLDIQLYYRHMAEKGIIYSRIILRKDSEGIYRVSGITSSPIPHEKFRTAVKFNKK